MPERERTDTSQQSGGDPLPASLPHILACGQCNGSIWRAASLNETSIVYHCVGCGAGVCLIYDAATRSWTTLGL